MKSAPISPSKLKAKFHAGKRSLTVWFSASVPVILALAEAVKDNIPFITNVMSGWGLVAVSVVVSALVAVLRVRQSGVDANAEGNDGGEA